MPLVLMLSTSRPTGQRKVSWLTSGTIGYSHQVSRVSLSDHRLTLWRKWEKKRNLLVVIYLLESRTNISERGQKKHLESGTIARPSGIDAKKKSHIYFRCKLFAHHIHFLGYNPQHRICEPPAQRLLNMAQNSRQTQDSCTTQDSTPWSSFQGNCEFKEKRTSLSIKRESWHLFAICFWKFFPLPRDRNLWAQFENLGT